MRGSSRSEDEIYDRGLELTTPSISTIAVSSSFREKCARPVVLRRQRSLSGSQHTFKHAAPPWCSFHIENPLTALDSKVLLDGVILKGDEEILALKVFPLSDRNLRGSPLLAANRFKHLMKVLVDKSSTMSK